MAMRLASEREAARLRLAGKHSLGGNLYLQVGKTGSRSWVARITDPRGARRDVGLGSYSVCTLGEAREKVRTLRRAVAAGIDPLSALKPRIVPTFAELARQVHSERTQTFRNGKHRAQWITTLETYAFPYIGRKPIDQVTSADVMGLLRPIWTDKAETARRVLQRVAAVVSYAVPEGHCDSELAVKGIRQALPKQLAQVRHHPAVAVGEAPRVYRAVECVSTMSAKALLLLMLTASRSAQVRAARWSEFDLIEGAWTIPAARMKANRVHRIPLSPEAVRLLQTLPRFESGAGLVFPNPRGRPLSDTALSKTFKLAAPGCTVHGWRSTFKDWALEDTAFPDEVSEVALAHVAEEEDAPKTN